ncbi:MAG: hypothetical protein WBP29_07030 [Candidatus Zixiibacteriota bacterium]
MISSKSTLTALLVCFVLGLSASAAAGIGLRGGAMFPRGDFKNFAGNGWRAEVTADIEVFSVPFLLAVVSLSAIDFGKKSSGWVSGTDFVTQESKTSVTGGGVGLRIQPPTPMIKPFGEALLKLASIEQDYESGLGGSELKSRTKFGYQINAGLEFSIAPKVGLEAGGTWLNFSDTKFKFEEQEIEVDLQSFGLFVGLSLGIGL